MTKNYVSQKDTKILLKIKYPESLENFNNVKYSHYLWGEFL